MYGCPQNYSLFDDCMFGCSYGNQFCFKKTSAKGGCNISIAAAFFWNCEIFYDDGSDEIILSAFRLVLQQQ